MTTRPFPVNATMTAIAIGYANHDIDLIQEKVRPKVDVVSERFSWLEYPLAQAFTVPDMEVGRKGQVNQVELESVEHEGRIRDFGLEDTIPITDIDEAKAARDQKRSNYDPEGAAVEYLTNLVQLGREIRAATIVQNADNYDADRKITLADPEDKFSDYENSDPFEFLNEGMTKPLVYRANTIVMGQPVWEVLKRHPKLLKACKGGLQEDGAISRAQFAELMEIDVERLAIGTSWVNAAKKGQPANLTKVWGKSIQLLYVSSQKTGPMDNILTWGYTASLEDKIAGVATDRNVGLKGGHVVRVGERVNEIVCAKSLGYRIGAAIA